MFEFIRTHQKLMQIILLLLILPSFVAISYYGYGTSKDNGNVVAKVAGQPITVQELDQAQRQQMERLRQMFGDQVDPKMFDTPEARKDILDGLIAQRALAAEARNNKLSISDQMLVQTLTDIPSLRTSDGKLDKERYISVLKQQGMTPAGFEARLRQDLALQQIQNSIQGSAFAPKSVATKLSELNEQEREVQELLFKAADFKAEAKVTDDMLKAYYDKNGSQFEVPEQVKAEYVLLNNDAVMSQITVSDADIKSYYDQNAQRFSTPEQRQASHILITVNKNASADEKAKAKAKAEQVLAQVRKNPSDFAKLAKQYSQDPGSAEKGGDLGFFSKGMMVKPFEDAAFNLKQGEISDLVQSDFGYHIIRVTAIKPASQKNLDEVKGQIAAEIKQQLAAKKYTELTETFSNMVEDESGSLKAVAEKLNLKISVVDNLTRNGSPALPPNAPVNNPKFLEALFSDDAIKNKLNTSAVRVSNNTLISGRVLEYKPKTKKPFEEVKSAIRERVLQTEALALAKKKGEARLAELNAKPDTAGFSASKVVSRAKNPGLNSQAFMTIMKADAGKLPSHVGVELPGQGYAIYRINKVSQPANVDTARRQSEQQQITSALAQQETYAYIEALKKKAKVDILQPITVKKEAEAEED